LCHETSLRKRFASYFFIHLPTFTYILIFNGKFRCCNGTFTNVHSFLYRC